MMKRWIAGLAAAGLVTGIAGCSDESSTPTGTTSTATITWETVGATALDDLNDCVGEPETELPCQKNVMDRLQTDGYRLPETEDGKRALTAAESFHRLYADRWGAGDCTPATTTLDDLSCDSDARLLADNVSQIRDVLEKISQRS